MPQSKCPKFPTAIHRNEVGTDIEGRWVICGCCRRWRWIGEVPPVETSAAMECPAPEWDTGNIILKIDLSDRLFELLKQDLNNR